MSRPTKRKVSLTLDEDLVAELQGGGGALSAEVNIALRASLAERRRRKALGAFLDELAAEHGSLDAPEDELEISRWMSLLGGDSTGEVPDTHQRRAAG